MHRPWVAIVVAIALVLSARATDDATSIWTSDPAHPSAACTVGPLVVATPAIESNPNASLLQLFANESAFTGALLDLRSSLDADLPLVRAIVQGAVAFELSSNGYVRSRGLRVESGGVHINSGGLHVDAGGARVKGGLIIESGGLAVKDHEFSASKVAAISSELLMPLLEAKSESISFIGTVLNLEARSTLDFHYISAERSSKQVFSVNQDGDISTSGSIAAAGDVTMSGDLSVQGRVLFDHVVVSAGDSITIPSTAVYIEIKDDGASKQNKLIMPRDDAPAGVRVVVGQLKVISNMDSEPTSGAFSIPFNSSVALVYNGRDWRSIDALKVPIKVLEDITTFTAKNDLSIGNVTLEAQRFRSTALPSSAIVFVGSSGNLEGSSGLAYRRETLIAKSLRFDSLDGDFDASDHTIRNAVMENVRIAGGAIAAESVSVGRLGGIAVFVGGNLTASSTLVLDSEGRLALTDLHCDVDAHKHTLRNAHLTGGRLQNIESASFNEVILPAANPFSLLTVDVNSRVVSFDTLSFVKGTLNVPAIGGFTAAGPIDMDSQPVSNVAITSGYVSNVDLVSSKVIKLLGALAKDSNLTRLVRLSDRDELCPLRKGEIVSLGAVQLQSLVVEGGVELHGGDITGAHSLTSETGSFKDIYADSMTLKRGVDACDGNCSILGADADGRLGLMDFQALMKSAVSSNNDFDSMSVGSLLLKDNVGAGVLTTLSSGKVAVSDHIDVVRVTAKHASVEGGLSVGSLTLSKVRAPSVLGTNSKGVIGAVTDVNFNAVSTERLVSRGSVSTKALVIDGLSGSDVGPLRLLNVDGNGRVDVAKDVKLVTIEADSIKAAAIDSTSLRISGLSLLSTQTSSLLSVDKTGQVGVADSFSTPVLHATKIDSVEAKIDRIIAESIVASKLVVDAGTISAKAIHTKDLRVDGSVQFHDDLFIKGSLSVEGSVIGSGPYVDSSDSRLKRNVKPITNALDKVCRLNGVYFDYKTDEFSHRNFPSERQIGWIADDIKLEFPDLVVEDNDGYHAVAYARASAVIAEAVKELRHETALLLNQANSRLDSIVLELEHVRRELRLLKGTDVG